jgi:putative pyruvate formate lyase activating enzyme
MMEPAASLFRPLAATRASRALDSLRECRLCAWNCGVDRTAGPAGVCHSDSTARIFYEGIEWAGEAELVPTYTVSFAGCNMTCDFCLTGEQSQNAAAGEPLAPDDVAARIRQAASQLRSVTILGGEASLHLGRALEVVARIPRELDIVWKTNAYASPEGLALLEGIPDVVLADYKFGNDGCAERLAGVRRYTDVATANLRWGAQHARLIVRHLVMPGHVDCCTKPVLNWLANELPDVPVSLMTGYLPMFRAPLVGLGRTNRPHEMEEARSFARQLGIRLAPFCLASSSKAMSQADGIWIDRAGRICVDSASGPLIELLASLSPELELSS